jgi:hypothetical protein
MEELSTSLHRMPCFLQIYLYMHAPARACAMHATALSRKRAGVSAAHMHAYAHTHTLIHTHARTHACTITHTYTLTHTDIHTHTQVHKHTHT